MNPYTFVPTVLGILWLAAAVCGAALAADKGRSFPLFLVLGLIAAPVVLVVSVGLRDESGPFCPRCHGQLRGTPGMCPACGRELAAGDALAKLPTP